MPSQSNHASKACHPDHVTLALLRLTGAHSKGPEGAFLTMPTQEFLPRTLFPSVADWNTVLRDLSIRHTVRQSEDPNGYGERALGELPMSEWQTDAP